MSMLPRLRPKKFYDLVIEVAIVRPGPIQGNMVHPYLRRREGKEPEDYPSEKLREVLERTLGVPLFQEQAMQIAIVGAGFTAAEADRLRRAMASFRRLGVIEEFEDKFIKGMIANKYTEDFAKRCFSQIQGFSTYGFPESHAASFAILVYVSAWIKWRYPDVFACALLNSQPMGFYAPAQLVRDAIDHGVEVRPVDVNESQWDCTLEPLDGDRHALRLGFRQVKGLREEGMNQLVEKRAMGYRSPDDLRRRAGLHIAEVEHLARADAFRSMGLDRRQALWAVKGLAKEADLPLFAGLGETQVAHPLRPVPLPVMGLGEHVVEDYATTTLSLKRHPVALLRDGLKRDGFMPAAALKEMRDGQRVKVAGIVLVRQRPGTAKVVFITLEDETGIANLVVWPQLFERFRQDIMGARLLGCSGRLQREKEVIHVVVNRLEDLTPRLRLLRHPEAILDRGAPLATRSRDFH